VPCRSGGNAAPPRVTQDRDRPKGVVRIVDGLGSGFAGPDDDVGRGTLGLVGQMMGVGASGRKAGEVARRQRVFAVVVDDANLTDANLIVDSERSSYGEVPLQE